MSPQHIQPLIHTATHKDAEALADLITQLGYPATVDQMKERLERIFAHPEHQTYVAERDGKVVGFIGLDLYLMYERSGLQGRILALVVDENYRSQGVGAALVERAEIWFIERAAYTSLVTSRNTRVDAHRFYRGLGYEENGLRFFKLLGGGKSG